MMPVSEKAEERFRDELQSSHRIQFEVQGDGPSIAAAVCRSAAKVWHRNSPTLRAAAKILDNIYVK